MNKNHSPENKYIKIRNTTKENKKHYTFHVNIDQMIIISFMFFISYTKIKNIFNKLNNKRISSFDGIPNIVKYLNHYVTQYSKSRVFLYLYI